MTNCACGNRSPSMLMNGMDPPTPADIGGRPKWVREARCRDSASQGARGGAVPPRAGRRRREPDARPVRRIRLEELLEPARRARARRASGERAGRPSPPSAAGGRCRRPRWAGRPSAPVIASAGRHVWPRTSSTGSACTVRMPGRSGSRAARSPPITLATSRACRTRAGGTSTWKLARPDLAGPLVLQAREELAQDPEARGHHPGGARVDPLGQDLHRQLAARPGPGATSPPELVVVAARRRRDTPRGRASRSATPARPCRRAGRRCRSPRTSRRGRRSAREATPCAWSASIAVRAAKAA